MSPLPDERAGNGSASCAASRNESSSPPPLIGGESTGRPHRDFTDTHSTARTPGSRGSCPTSKGWQSQQIRWVSEFPNPAPRARPTTDSTEATLGCYLEGSAHLVRSISTRFSGIFRSVPSSLHHRLIFSGSSASIWQSGLEFCSGDFEKRIPSIMISSPSFSMGTISQFGSLLSLI